MVPHVLCVRQADVDEAGQDEAGVEVHGGEARDGPAAGVGVGEDVALPVLQRLHARTRPHDGE